VAIPHTLVLAVAILTLLCLPAIVAAIVCADELIERAARAMHQARLTRRERRAISRLDRSIGPIVEVVLVAPEDQERPTIEQIAADLHRLGQQRLGVAQRSQVWQTAVLRAYDEQLRLASACLGVTQHLSELVGVDLEIERVRVEGELQARGMTLPTAGAERREQR
jgi:thiamine biosynthesis lipoprotein ApbE